MNHEAQAGMVGAAVVAVAICAVTFVGWLTSLAGFSMTRPPPDSSWFAIGLGYTLTCAYTALMCFLGLVLVTGICCEIGEEVLFSRHKRQEERERELRTIEAELDRELQG